MSPVGSKRAPWPTRTSRPARPRICSMTRGDRCSGRAPSCAVLIGLMLFACPAPALGDSSGDVETARALFRSGRGLVAEGKYEQACPKFEQSLKLDPGLGTKFNLADCYEHLGKTATARTLFLEVAALARQAGQSD